MPKVRELTHEDTAAVRKFFESIPAEERTFFYQDVDDPAVVAAWAADDRRVRRCAVDDDNGALLALAALQPGLDWSSHVAELVLLVSPTARRQHLGRTMARAMLLEAVERGFAKVTVLMAADDAGAVEMFQKLGFEVEGVLRDQLRSPDGGTARDAVLLGHLVEETWSSMATGGFEQALL